MVGKGQPKKDPAEVKREYNIYLSQTQKETIEEARKIEAPEKRFGAYIRDCAVNHAEHVLNVKAVDDVFKAHNAGERQLKNND